MSVKKRPKKFQKKKNVKKTRKEIRKEKRQLVKVKKNEFYQKKHGHQIEQVAEKAKDNKKKIQQSSADLVAKQQQKEQSKKRKLEKQMKKNRKKQLLEANDEEDRVIKQLEKQLKLNKKKTKGISKSFVDDGLDYILEMCDEKTMKDVAAAEKNLVGSDSESEFDDDFAIATGKEITKKNKKSSQKPSNSDDDFGSMEEDFSDSETEQPKSKISKKNLNKNSSKKKIDDSDDEFGSMEEDFTTESETEQPKSKPTKKNLNKKSSKKSKNLSEDDFGSMEEDFSSDTEREQPKSKPTKRKLNKKALKKSKILDDDFSSMEEDLYSDNKDKKSKSKKKIHEDNLDDFLLDGEISDEEQSMPKKTDSDDEDFESMEVEENDHDDTEDKPTEWEDIYGRKRDAKGNVIEEQTSKYIPPALRNKPSNKDIEEQLKLKRQLKGQLNRLTEANLVSISQQIESLYTSGTYSRHNLNSILCELINAAVVENNALTSTQTVADHALLLAVLHANIDIEIGANYLQFIVETFNKLIAVKLENKKLENSVHIISQLYNLKLFHCGLMHDLLKNLLDNGLTERNIESILLMLKTVGPTLRKDDPVALKDTLLYIQRTISEAPEDVKQSSRLKFMSDILMAIKNNNFTKIPNYSADNVEHLRKVLRAAIRKGNYVTQLNIALDDLLNVEQRGKWWVVGSAWTGKSNENKSDKEETKYKSDGFSEQILELARKQRMNTDIRRNVFCILMTAEDYLDAFEKLLHLGLKGQQDREIIHVLMHCCLQEKNFNPYYAVLAQKFSEYDRKYQIALQCLIWDKLKDLKNFTTKKITNLSKFLTFMLINGGLPLSTLKVIELSELDKPTVRLLRQTLLGVLLNDDVESVGKIWERAGRNAQFKQALRLFIQHFILRGKSMQTLGENEQDLLRERVRTADKILSLNEKRVQF